MHLGPRHKQMSKDLKGFKQAKKAGSFQDSYPK